jgi:hypothetical protein
MFAAERGNTPALLMGIEMSVAVRAAIWTERHRSRPGRVRGDQSASAGGGRHLRRASGAAVHELVDQREAERDCL